MLLVDVGNSRVKWAMLSGGELGPQSASVCHAWGRHEWLDWARSVGAAGRVLVANVAGADVARELSAALQSTGSEQVEFVQSTAAAAGLRNAYRDPQQLGVDRWVALIGAWHLQRGACCVLDIGTAATMDAATADGQHLGGYIVPGPGLMRESLHAGTSDLAGRWSVNIDGGDDSLADNTRDAIDEGVPLCVAAFADRVVEDVAAMLGETPALWVTGGGAGPVLSLLRNRFRVAHDLVLRGLAVLGGEPVPTNGLAAP
jgi:type III pantothenate kinase